MRTKQVFPNSNAVIHLFAQRTQDSARCSNVFFDDKDKIFSYGRHYLLAEFLDDKTILINDTGYSVTTAKHIREIRWATKQYKQFFTTQSDLDSVYSQIISLKEKLAVSRKPEMYVNPILALWKSLNEFAEYRRLKSKYNKDEKYKKIKQIVRKLEDNYADFQKELLARQKKELEQKKKNVEKQLAILLPKFKNYEIQSFRIGDEDFLRLSKDKTHVESSQGIAVKTENARKLYKMIKAGKDIKGFDIEGYTVISLNGTLKIGCHRINIDSVHEIGQQI